MSITAERKTELVKEYATAEGDTGSPEVQVAILTDENPQSHRASEDPRRTFIRVAAF